MHWEHINDGCIQWNFLEGLLAVDIWAVLGEDKYESKLRRRYN